VDKLSWVTVRKQDDEGQSEGRDERPGVQEAASADLTTATMESVATSTVEKPPDSAREGAMVRFRERIRRNPLLNTTWRIGVFTVGVTVLLAGIVMLIGPGQGILVIIVGLAILATEFVWAQRALHHAKKAARRAKDAALDPRTRRRNTIIAVLLGLVVAAVTVWYLEVYGLALPWKVLSWEDLPWS
jgi:uncharacterized protein (TIGR02611 family)